MTKLPQQTKDLTQENIKRIAELFPEAITETKDEQGQLKTAVNFSVLKQLLSDEVVDGDECYEFTWVGKKQAMIEANRPIRKTLRPAKSESKNWDTTENLYIEGDNLDVLKLLQNSYLNSIKMIYIDPPYNTGNDFVYRDNFAVSKEDYEGDLGVYDEEDNRLFKNTETNGRYHSDWCSMMYPRLQLSRNLLSDDGVIFISIDDNEVHNLRKICDDVFGETNFIGTLSVENNPKGRKNSDFISVSSEHLHIYAKNKSESYFIENIPKNSNDMKEDENGNYVHNSGKRVLIGENSFNKPVSNFASEKNYSVYYRETDKSTHIRKEKWGQVDESLLNNGYKKYYSYFNNQLVENTYTKTKFETLIKNSALEFTNNKVFEKNFNDTIRIKSQLTNRKYEAIVNGKKENFSLELTTTGAGTYLKALFETDIAYFDAPKNNGLLKLLITLIDDKNFIILDIFSGSSTTADATMQLNAEDSGNRKFIMVQLPEKTDEKSEAYKAGYKNICEIGKERIRRAGKKIEEELQAKSKNGGLFSEQEETKTVDTGFRVLKLDDTNMKDVYYSAGDYSQQMLLDLESNIKEDRTDLDLLFGVMLDWGVPLSLPHITETIGGKQIHFVNGTDLVACFEENITETVVREIAKRKPLRVVFRDSSFGSSPEKINVSEIFKTLSGDTTIKVI